MFKILNREIQEKKRWKNSSPRTERKPQLRKYLPDDRYFENLRFREPIFRFIIENFNIDPLNPLSYLDYPILLLGVYSTPLAIELSQWSYPATLIVQNEYEKERVMANVKRHAGKLWDILTYNFFQGVPSSRIIIWVDDYFSIPEKRKLEYLQYLKKRCRLLVAAIKDGPERKKIISSLPNVIVREKYGNYYLVISY